jgi:hypothetical protein
MAQELPRLKLGKRAAFVKTHLKRLPQEKATWAVDFRALPKPAHQTDTHYLGLAVALPRGDPLVGLPVEYSPTVNDLADLLADAMRRPLTGSARRPEHLHFRANPQWEEVYPRCKRLRQEDETWEADFQALPKPITHNQTHYLGMVVAPDSSFLANSPIEGRPTVNDMATLLAHAMRRPLVDTTGVHFYEAHLHRFPPGQWPMAGPAHRNLHGPGGSDGPDQGGSLDQNA